MHQRCLGVGRDWNVTVDISIYRTMTAPRPTLIHYKPKQKAASKLFRTLASTRDCRESRSSKIAHAAISRFR